MRVSQRFKLGLSQSELDFVDVDIRNDVPLCLDPRALRLLRTSWGQECVSLVQDYFTAVLGAVRDDDVSEGRRLLGGLHEPNETHLGLSRGSSKGSAIGEDLASDLWDSLSQNKAVRASGLLEDLEETALLVPGIDRDRISDIVTNVIREPLIRYTQAMCGHYGIPVVAGIDSGPLWSPAVNDWLSHPVSLPRVPSGKLLLVPKSIVRRKLDFNQSDYFNHYVLEYLKGVELSAGSSLVQLLKDGTPRVTKKDLKVKYGTGKTVAADLTREYPDMLDQYRSRDPRRSPPLSHEDLANGKRDLPRWDDALADLQRVPTGSAAAKRYEDAVEKVLSLVMHPDLTFPVREHKIHQGRKRIDIVYTNAAGTGFFDWLARHYPAAHVVIECKNYPGDPANPELDQIAGRFSPSRGRVGLLCCRRFENKDLFWERCVDTAHDDRGWIIPMDDDDLADLVGIRKSDDTLALWEFYKARFDRLID
jgi:hypothetical protein